jgi:apolipoprotein N-acyltransferase
VKAKNRARRGAAGVLPLGWKVASALALLSGVLYFLAFPGADLWPLSFVALTPLIVALQGQSPKRATWLGWLAGFTMTMIGFYWLLDMLETFSGFGVALCFVFTAILCGYQAGRIGFLGWLHARISAKGYPGELAFALGFAASEQAFPLLFPWSYAATVHQVPALTQLAEIGGPILVALPLVAANLALAELVLARLQKRAFHARKVALFAAVPVAAALYGAIRIPMVDAATAAAPKGRVGLVQANMSLYGKHHNKGEGLRRHVDLTRQLTSEGKLDLVVWSETSVMSAMDEEDLSAAVPNGFAATLGVPSLFGAVIVKHVDDARRYVLYNSALLSDVRGTVLGRFDKQKLVMFSESMPFGETFPILYEWSPNSSKFVPGSRFDPLTFGSHQVATIICYEDIIAGFVNRIVNNGDPDLIANLTNDAWFGDTTEPWIHLALATLRAVEHRRYFVRSTNSGVSAIIDPVGRVVAHTDTFKEQAIAGEVAWLHAHTLYEMLGDTPWWLATAVALALVFAPRRARNRPNKGKTDPGSAGRGANAPHADLDTRLRQKARAWFARESGDSSRHGE